LEQQIGGVERQELVDIARKEDDTPAAAIAIGGLAVNLNVEGLSDFRSWVRLPWLAHDETPGPYITIPQYWFNKTKQHTHPGP